MALQIVVSFYFELSVLRLSIQYIFKHCENFFADVIISPSNDIDLSIIALAMKRTSNSISVDHIEPANKKPKSMTPYE